MSSHPHRPARLRHRRFGRPPPARRAAPTAIERVDGRPGRGRARPSCATRRRRADAPAGLLTTDFARLRDDPSITVVAEVMGGDRADPRVPARAARGRQVGRLGQQAAARPARRGALRRRRARTASSCASRPACARRSRCQGAARVDDRDRRPPHRRHRQRHDELHPEPDGADGRTPTPTRWPRPRARLRRGRPDRGRHRRRRRGQDRDPGVDRLPHARRTRTRSTMSASTGSTWPTSSTPPSSGYPVKLIASAIAGRRVVGPRAPLPRRPRPPAGDGRGRVQRRDAAGRARSAR